MTKPKESLSKESKGALEAKRDELLDAEAKDSPVLSLITKRLRAARKKVKKVEEIEAIKASGREINTDQEESLKGKAKNLANIEELDRLLPLLKEAVAAEVSQKLGVAKAEIEAAAAVAAAEKAAEEAKAIAEAHDIENTKARALADELRAQVEAAAERAAANEAQRTEDQAAHEARLNELQTSEKTNVREAVTRLLQLVYFSRLFSIEGRNEQDYLHQMERDACISYVADAGEVLHQDDFNAICLFGKLISSRPQGELISHEAALERCKAFALDWVAAAETRIPNLNVTVNELVVKFESIIGSGFYTIKPEMKGAHEVNSKGFLDPSVLTPPGRDVGASSFPSASFGQSQTIPQTSSNNLPLQQILGHHAQQIPGERQPSAEHGLTNGFIPYSSGFKPSANTGFAGSLPHSNVHQQLPPLTDNNSQKQNAGAPETHAPAPSFQGGSLTGGVAPKPEIGSQAAPGRSGSGTAPLFPGATPSAAADTSATSTGQALAESGELPAEATVTERKNSYNAPQGVRPRPQPEGRGRGPPRGRGGGRGDFVPRGGSGRRGGPGRGGFRGGRGREGTTVAQPSQPFAQQAGQY